MGITGRITYWLIAWYVDIQMEQLIELLTCNYWLTNNYWLMYWLKMNDCWSIIIDETLTAADWQLLSDKMNDNYWLWESKCQ